MGLDLWFYPVWLDSPSIRMIRTDAAAWETAVGGPFCPSPRGAVPDMSLRLQAELPCEVYMWNYPDRSYGQAEYLLDPAGYRTLVSWQERERSLPYRIIEGEQRFAAHAVGGQGVAWRCSTAAFLAEAVAVIDGLDPAAVSREFSVAEMDELGVYKVHPSENDDEVFARVLQRLRQLGRYCRELTARGVDLIVVKD